VNLVSFFTLFNVLFLHYWSRSYSSILFFFTGQNVLSETATPEDAGFIRSQFSGFTVGFVIFSNWSSDWLLDCNGAIDFLQTSAEFTCMTLRLYFTSTDIRLLSYMEMNILLVIRTINYNIVVSIFYKNNLNHSLLSPY